jgi:hypothetical protein
MPISLDHRRYRAAARFFCCGSLLLALANPAASAFFNFNTDPTVSGLLTLYGNAAWQPTGGAAAATFTILPGVLFTGSGYLGSDYLSNGVFVARVSGPTNNTYVLQGSTDFQNWVSVSTNVPVSSPFTVTDPQAGTFRNRFYRVMQLP